MATLSMHRLKSGQAKRLLLYVPESSQRRKALGVSGALQQLENPDLVAFPLEPLAVDDLRSVLGSDLEIDVDVGTWRAHYQTQAQASVSLGAQTEGRPNVAWSGRLYPYQRVGADWMRTVPRAILGDDPGLGKTIQSLTAVCREPQVLIVTLNSVKSHWETHIRSWLQRDVCVCTGTHSQRQSALDTRPDWVIINHEMLRGGSVGYRGIVEREWDAVIVDEAHKLQGRKSAQSLGAARLKARRLYLLTGTPIWNHPDSLWRILNLLAPQRFNSYWRFVTEYCDTQQTNWGLDILGFRLDTLERLRSIVAPYLLRRRKEEVLPDLPAKRRQLIEYDLSDMQRRAYREMKRRLRLVTEDGDLLRVYDNAMVALGQLRLLCDAPQLVGLPPSTNPKDEVLDELLETLLDRERKVIVFTWHKVYAEYLAARHAHYGVTLVTGNTSHRDRELQAFRQEPDKHLLVATIGAAGTGIDLVEATAAIFAEGTHVPTLNAQAEDRLHRIGQKTDVMIYRLAARNTVESTIWQVSDDRQDQNDELLSMRVVVDRVLASQE